MPNLPHFVIEEKFQFLIIFDVFIVNRHWNGSTSLLIVQIEKEDNHILSVAPAQCVYSKWGTFCTLLTQIGAIKRIRRSTQILYGIPKINFIYNGKQLSVLSALHRFFDFSTVTGECPTGVSVISNDKVTRLIR